MIGLRMIILLSGKAGAGKDTFADSISTLGFKKYAFATDLKGMAKRDGWNGEKDLRGRRLLQDIGSAWREYDPLYWVKRVQRKILCDPDYMESIMESIVFRAAISDCRYENEVDEMRTWGEMHGFTVFSIRIERPGHDNGLSKAAKGHLSETALDDYDFDLVVPNEDSLMAFCHQAREVTKCLIESCGLVSV